MNTQQELQKLSELMKKPLENWNPDITWDLTAKRYADMMAKGRATAQAVNALSKEDQLSEKIENLIGAERERHRADALDQYLHE